MRAIKRLYFIRSSDKILVRPTVGEKRWAKKAKFEEDVRFGCEDDEYNQTAELESIMRRSSVYRREGPGSPKAYGSM